MYAKELRIGNWVKLHLNDSYATEFTIELADLNLIANNILGREYSAILLTEDWLVKFGFELVTEHEYKKKFIVYGDDIYSLYIFPAINNTGWVLQLWNIFDKDNDTDRDQISLPLEVERVHQLQNIYYALTGEELTI